MTLKYKIHVSKIFVLISYIIYEYNIKIKYKRFF